MHLSEVKIDYFYPNFCFIKYFSLMKTRITLLLYFLLSTILSSLAQNDNSDLHDFEFHVCKHQDKFASGLFNKSVINPNPFMENYDVTFYKLDIEAYDTTNQFSGFAQVSGIVTSSILDTFSIELSTKLSADSTFINGIKYDFEHTAHNITVPLTTTLSQGAEFNFVLYYHTPGGYTTNYFSATQASTYGDFNVSQTFSEPYFAHEWMPCKQELEDKADSVHIFITTDDDLKVAGPGLLTEVMLPNNKVRHEWRTYYPTAF